ncbi:MAG TPA: pitrilysin family protein [Pyrinomonadaceae bacterium]|nr:pitrilysin family protein [Pyrinomonadaceae bacterium]
MNRLNLSSVKGLLTTATALLVFSGLFSLSTIAQFGQDTPEPRREQLLNGLNVFLSYRPGDPQAILKLRIHGGAAFDLEDKDGLMALLGDMIFPDPATRQYVTGDLAGRLEVTTTFDAITITLTGRAEEFERLAEIMRNALVSQQITDDSLRRLRDARIKTARELNLAPETIADRAAARRIYGTYPYGRSVSGSPETLSRIDRTDLLRARERFFNPNNATLVYAGGVELSRVRRTLRQFLGVWRKSERVVPATFRQPAAADARALIINFAGMPGAEVRVSARGVALTDRDVAGANVLSLLAHARWLAAVPELKGSAVLVRHDGYALGGVFRMSASVSSPLTAAKALEAARGVLQSLADVPPSTAEFETAKRESLAILNRDLEKPDAATDAWLDAQIYNRTMADVARSVNALTPADVQRVAAKLFREAPIASVLVGDAAKLRDDVARIGPVEVMSADATSETKPNAETPKQTPGLQIKRP